MSVTIKSATLKGGMFLSYKYVANVNNAINTTGTASDAVVHEDLKHAFRNLIPFFAHISEEIIDDNLVESAIEDPEEHLVKSEDEDEARPFLKYRVDSFSMGAKKDGECVTLTGTKYLNSGDAIGWETPLIKFDGDYRFSSQLYDAITLLRSEVFEYSQGKQAAVSDGIAGLWDGEEEDQEDDI